MQPGQVTSKNFEVSSPPSAVDYSPQKPPQPWPGLDREEAAESVTPGVTVGGGDQDGDDDRQGGRRAPAVSTRAAAR